MPTYPFAKKRFWLEAEHLFPVKGSTDKIEKGHIHPLLHSNESDFLAQKFQSTFTGKEAFLEDHQVENSKVLPGVAYLEMARVAGEISLRQPIYQLRDITWVSPVRMKNDPQTIQISLFEQEGFTGYEVYSGEGGDEIIHFQGKLSTEAQPLPQAMKINQILGRLTKQTRSVDCCLLYTSPSPRDRTRSRMPSSA